MSRILREVWLFFWRDLIIARSYRTVFVLEALEAFFGTATLYYVARLVDSAAVRQELPQGESYFAFSLVGYVFLDYLNAALNTFDNSLMEGRDSGTLEHVLVTQTSLPVFLAGSLYLSVCIDDAAHRGVHRVGRDPVWVSAGPGELDSSGGRADCQPVGFFRAGDIVSELCADLQAGQSGEMVVPGIYRFDERHAVSGERAAARAAIFCAAESSEVRAGCHARGAAGGLQHGSVVEAGAGAAGVCGGAAAAIDGGVWVVIAADEGDGDADAPVKKGRFRMNGTGPIKSRK